MASQPPGPLTDADFEDLKAQLKNLDEAERVLDQATRGGIDVSEQRARSRELRERVTKLKNAFFPGR